MAHLLFHGLAAQTAVGISKVLLMPALGLWLYSIRSEYSPGILKAAGAALFFSWLGDVLLIDKSFFVFGLGAFLIGHLLYIYAFWRHPDRTHHGRFWTELRFGAIILCVYAGFALFTVMPNTGAFQTPVVAYGFVIGAMAVSSTLNRSGQARARHAFAGAALFVISDSLIAWNKFYIELPLAGLWIMVTYLSAQFFLISGLRLHAPE